MAGLRLRLRHRSPRHAEIRHGRSARLLRRRPALAAPLRLLRARRADPVGRRRGMKFTLGWLHEHLDSDASLDTIAETLTSVGLEVEGIEDPAAKLAPFTIARVLTAERHPQADKLQ